MILLHASLARHSAGVDACQRTSNLPCWRGGRVAGVPSPDQ